MLEVTNNDDEIIEYWMNELMPNQEAAGPNAINSELLNYVDCLLTLLNSLFLKYTLYVTEHC